MDIFEQNKAVIDKRISQGLDLIRKNYELEERDTKEFKHICIQNMDYLVKQYAVKGVGNLLIMTCSESKMMQMDSFVITPYYKNLPLFSTDYIYIKEKRNILNEIYNLTDQKDELYNSYIKKFSKVSNMYKNLPDMPGKPSWLDSIRSVRIAKSTGVEEDEAIIKIFMENLQVFIEMEKETPLLDKNQYKNKWQKTQDYVDGLIHEGGISTDMFKAVLGIEKTKEFFNSVFFAPALYK